jgi:hypothetical protein
MFKWAEDLGQHTVWLQTGRPGFDPGKAKDFSFSSFSIQTGSGTHSASYTVGTGGLLPEDKARPGRDADHSLPFSAEVKEEYLLSPKRHHGV